MPVAFQTKKMEREISKQKRPGGEEGKGVTYIYDNIFSNLEAFSIIYTTYMKALTLFVGD